MNDKGFQGPFSAITLLHECLQNKSLVLLSDVQKNRWVSLRVWSSLVVQKNDKHSLSSPSSQYMFLYDNKSCFQMNHVLAEIPDDQGISSDTGIANHIEWLVTTPTYCKHRYFGVDKL